MNVLIDGVKYVPEPQKPTGNELLAALETRFDSDAGDGLTVREWLHSLLKKLWLEQEDFNGKRPWGNSSWEYDVFTGLADAKLIKFGKKGSDGVYDYCTDAQVAFAHSYVHKLIDAIFFGVSD